MKHKNILWVALAVLISVIVWRGKLKKDSVGQELFTGEVGEYVGMVLPRDTVPITRTETLRVQYDSANYVSVLIDGTISFCCGFDSLGKLGETNSHTIRWRLDSNGVLHKNKKP